jgi:hypothetical protein
MVRNFPLLVRLDNGNFDFSQAATSGSDLRFARADGQILAHEIGGWNSKGPSPAAEIWVKVDSLAVNGDSAVFSMYWGNVSAASTSDGASVFDPAFGHSGVYHLSEPGTGLAGEFKDATGRYDGTGGNGDVKLLPEAAEAAVGMGQEFRPGHQGLITLPGDFDPGAEAWTVQFWIKKEGASTNEVVFRKGEAWTKDTPRFQLILPVGPSNLVKLEQPDDIFSTKVSLPDNAFLFLGVVYTGSRADVYVNGEYVESKPFTQAASSAGRTLLGASSINGSQGFSGVLNEVWSASTTRTAAWIKLEYENQKPGSRLVKIIRVNR